VVSVQAVGGENFAPAKGIEIALCGLTCTKHGATNVHGICQFNMQRESTTGLHLELTDPSDVFPHTIFYPAYLSDTPLQPIPLYVISSELVSDANDFLVSRGQVLADAAQSIILPSACRPQDLPTPTGVTFHVERDGLPVPRCRARNADAPVPESPCIWYGTYLGPDLTASSSQGWGGGIVGLPSGNYTISVCDGEKLVSQRPDIEMRNGALTIVRTWPLTATDMDRVHDNPCAPQDSSPMMPDSSAN
jgi:hypothetical protein